MKRSKTGSAKATVAMDALTATKGAQTGPKAVANPAKDAEAVAAVANLAKVGSSAIVQMLTRKMPPMHLRVRHSLAQP